MLQRLGVPLLRTGVVIEARQVIGDIPTPPLPTGLAIWGDFLYVTHFWSGQVSLIYLPMRQVVETVSTGADTGLLRATGGHGAGKLI